MRGWEDGRMGWEGEREGKRRGREDGSGEGENRIRVNFFLTCAVGSGGGGGAPLRRSCRVFVRVSVGSIYIQINKKKYRW